MLKAVIFDFDGVLADSEPLHYQAFQKVLVPLGLGHSYERYLEHFIGFDDRDAFREIFGEANRPLDAATLASLIESKSAAFKTIVAKGVRPFPGAASLVADLIRNEVPLAIASGALKDEIRLVLTALRLGSAFSIIVGADDVQRSKPDPESYLLAFQRLAKVHDKSNLNRRDCVVIEDTPAGVQAAKSAGLFCVAVTHTSSVEGLASADHVVKSLEGLNYEVLVGVLGRRKA